MMTDLVTTEQASPPIGKVSAWTRRLQQWLLQDDNRTTAGTVTPTPATTPTEMVDHSWTIDRLKLTELLWGEGWHTPLGEHMASVMVRPFGLTKEMATLDLAAGLGGMGQKIVTEFHSYVTGFETDAARAEQGAQTIRHHNLGKHFSITPYMPADFRAKQRFDAVVAGELFYQVPDKKAFIAQIAASLKDYSHVSWTDFVVVDEAGDAGLLENWLAVEPVGSQPIALKDVASLWKPHKLNIHVSEDRTGHYVEATTAAHAKLMHHLAKVTISPTVKPLLLGEVDYWSRRIAALSSNLRFYRFYATKN